MRSELDAQQEMETTKKELIGTKTEAQGVMVESQTRISRLCRLDQQKRDFRVERLQEKL